MRSAVLLLCCLPLLAAAPARERIEIPDLPTADMRMSWQDFKELLELFQDRAPDSEEPEPERPPVPWSVRDVAYDIDATDPAAIRVDAVMRLFVWSDEWSTVPVLDAATALDAVSLNGEEAFLTRKEGLFVLYLNEPGDHTLAYSFFVPAKRNEGVVSIVVPAQPMAPAKVRLQVAEREAIVSAPEAASVRVHRHEEGLEAELSFAGSEAIALRWQLPARPAPPEPEVPLEPPRIACMTPTIATLSDNFISSSSLLHFDVLRGETNAFTIHLPAGVQVLAVEGTGVSWDTVETADGQRLEVALNHAVTKHYALQIRHETHLPAAAATIELPRLEVEGMARQRGYLAIGTEGNVEVHAPDEVEGAKRIDVSELPAELRARSMNPILHAYQYNDPDFLLPLDFRRLQDVPVRVATIDQARITTIITPEGMLVQRAHYSVRNHHKKFLRIEVGEDAEVWTARVAGELARPARDGEDNTAVLLPLRKSAPQAHGGGAFSVELTWMRRIELGSGWRSRIDLAVPRTDLMANEVKWEVFLPEDRVVYRTEGDITAMSEAHSAPAMLHLARETFGRTEAKQIPRLREGIERFLITDINNPAGSAIAQSRTFEDALDIGSERPRPGVQVAGVLPVEMNLPRVGRPHYFERTIVQENTELLLVLDTYHTRLQGIAKFLAALAAFTIGWVVVWLLTRGMSDARALAILLVLIALTAGLAPAYAGAAMTPWIRWACLGGALVLIRALLPAAKTLLSQSEAHDAPAA